MEPLNLDAFEAAARETLPRMTYDFIAGGAEDERSVTANRAALDARALRNRVELLRAELDLSLALVGAPSLADLVPDLVV